MAADAVVVMARYPTPGAVKTRLARQLGADATCALYRAFLADIQASLAGSAWELVWAVTPPQADLRAIVGAGARQIAQRGDDLAARMWHAFADLFAAGAARVVMIGADAPHLGAARVAAAFEALGDADAVFVPTRDGGYCLVGLAAPRDLFAGIAMGTATVFAETMARAHGLGLRTVVLPATFDVDEIDDVRELQGLIASGAVRLAHTRAALLGTRL
jgi:rSAM/selenodomain-associated transferase 1